MGNRYKGNKFNKSEKLVSRALKIIKKEEGIVHFIHSRQNGQLDSSGMDFLIFVTVFVRYDVCVLCIPLQVKSKEWAIRKHKRKHPHVETVVVVRPEETLQKVIQRLEKIIKIYIHRLTPA